MTSKSETPTCCCCFHVRVGTFLVAVLFLIAGIFNVVAASLFLSNAVPYQDFMSTVYDDDTAQTYSRSAMWFVLVNGFILVLIGALAIYGLMKKRAAYLLPMLILQLLDFLCTIVYISGLMFYWPSVKLTIATCRHMPEEWKEWLLNLDDRWLALLVFGLLFTYLFIRSYLISMVYRCFKFVSAQQTVLRQRQNPEISFVPDVEQNAAPIYKPPKYEDIQKLPLVDDVEEIDTKPPPYSTS